MGKGTGNCEFRISDFYFLFVCSNENFYDSQISDFENVLPQTLDMYHTPYLSVLDFLKSVFHEIDF